MVASPETIETYQDLYTRRGFAILRSFFSLEETDAFRAEADRVAALDGLCGDPLRGLIRTGAPRRDRVDPVLDVSPLFAAVATGPRLLGLASEILGGEAQLLKDKLILKPPGATGYGVHQDVPYWHELGGDTSDAMSVAVCIDHCTEENGAVEFAPGFHDRLLTVPGVAADPDESLFPSFDMAVAEPGDIVIFTGLTPHRSGGNRSDACRRMLFLTYSRDERPNLYEQYQRLRLTF